MKFRENRLGKKIFSLKCIAQHLVSGIVYEEFDGARTVGNQIHSDRSRIDFNPISFDDESWNS